MPPLFQLSRRGLNNRLIPHISIAFGEAYRQIRAGHAPQRYEAEYVETVSDRLVAWPAGEFDRLRPELIEAMQAGEDYDQIRDRVGAVLGIDSRTRTIRAEITDIEDRLQNDPDLGPVSRKALTARRRVLWREHDESLGEWRWKARRIARTEGHAATEAAKLKAAQDAAYESGQAVFKRWRATRDLRVRASHRVADGQVVRLADSFRVGAVLLRFPGDPTSMAAHEIINCRCVSTIWSGDMLQDGLQGPDGSIGEVKPGGVRIGPDDPDAAEQAIADVGGRPDRPPMPTRPRQEPERPEPVELTEDRVVPMPDLSRVDDDELAELLGKAHDARDDDLYEWADAEWERRRAQDDAEHGFGERDHDDSGGESPPPIDPPDEPSAGGGDDDDRVIGGPTAADADELATYLDLTMPGDDLTEDEQAAVVRWQGMDRFYERIQESLRGDDTSAPEVDELVDVLDDLIDAHPLDKDIVVWRGIRNSRAMFGVGSGDLESVVGSTLPPAGFIATSASRSVAVSFTDPGRDPVVVRLLARAGTGALWVSRAGDQHLQDQRELLFRAAALYIVGISFTEDGTVLVEMEMR